MNKYKIKNHFVNSRHYFIDEWLELIDYNYLDYLSNSYLNSNGNLNLFHYGVVDVEFIGFTFSRFDHKHIFIEDLTHDIETYIRCMKIDKLLEI